MILTDKWIKSQAGMIEPFIDHTVREIEGRKACSFGLSSAGYDIRLSDRVYARVKNQYNDLVDDPKFKNISRILSQELDVQQTSANESFVEVPPGAAIASSIEYIKMPRNAVALLYPKSSYARCGIHIINPLIEPEWCGNLTISFINANPNPVRLYIGEGFAQMVFYSIDEIETSYVERGGLYQDTRGVAFANV